MGHAERRGLQSTLLVVVAITCVAYCVVYFLGVITLNRATHIATFTWSLTEEQAHHSVWSPFTVTEMDCMLFLMLMSGIGIVSAVAATGNAAVSTHGRTFCARLPPASRLRWLKIKLLNGKLRSIPFHVAAQKSYRLKRRGLWRMFSSTANQQYSTAARGLNSACVLCSRSWRAWRRGESWRKRNWQTLSVGTQVFFLLYAMLVSALPSADLNTAPLTPSQY